MEVLQGALSANPAQDLTPITLRLEVLENMIGGLRGAIDDIQNGFAAADQERATIVADLFGLRQEIVAAAAAAGDPQAGAELGGNIAALGDRLTALEGAVPGVEFATLELLVEQLQTDLTTLNVATNELAANAEERDRTADAALVFAIDNLRFAADRGEPFATELAVLAEFGIEQGALAEITPMAESGVSGKAELAAAFDELAFDILDATNQAGPDAGFWERLFGNARGVVSFRPTAAIEGETTSAIVSRMQAAVDAGDFAAALAERMSLTDAAVEVSNDWAERVETRLNLDAAIDDLAIVIQRQIAE